MGSKSSIFLLLCVVIGIHAYPHYYYNSPFALVDEYVENFAHGMEEMKALSRAHRIVQRDYNEIEHNEVKTLEHAEEYDFIIIGAGATGSVLANRLSEIPEWKILLLDAGSAETTITQVPSMQPFVRTSPFNWPYTTVPQNSTCLGMIHQECAVGTGKGLGGDTVTNDMLYSRGHPKDYDIWADAGLIGWCWNSVQPYFKKIEDIFAIDLDRKQHRYGGPVHVENIQLTTPLTPHLFEAVHQMGLKKIDYNGKERLGFGIPQVTTKDGKRQSAAQSYLLPAYKRNNLVVKPLSEATKIIISDHTKEATGVTYLHEGKMYHAKNNKEIILAAGPIKSPQLLMLSGIGPKEHLEHLKIPVHSDVHVGHNLKDHIAFIGLNFIIEHGHEMYICDEEADAISYLKNGKGPLTSNGIELIGFLQTTLAKHLPNYPDIEFLITRNDCNLKEQLRSWRVSDEMYKAFWEPVEGKAGFTIQVVLLHPKSKGYLKLHDKDPLHQPLINLNALSDEDDVDIETLLEGVHLALKFAETESMQHLGVKLNPHKIPGCELYEGNEYWTCAIKHLTVSKRHITGTAKMGVELDKDAVVSQELKVSGIHKLRVADSSVIPVTISGHLMAAEYMIGENAADFIKKEWAR